MTIDQGTGSENSYTPFSVLGHGEGKTSEVWCVNTYTYTGCIPVVCKYALCALLAGNNPLVLWENIQEVVDGRYLRYVIIGKGAQATRLCAWQRYEKNNKKGEGGEMR